MNKLILILAVALGISACGGSSSGSNGSNGGDTSTMPPGQAADAFTSAVITLAATTPEDTEPAAVETAAVTAPEDSEPAALK